MTISLLARSLFSSSRSCRRLFSLIIWVKNIKKRIEALMHDTIRFLLSSLISQKNYYKHEFHSALKRKIVYREKNVTQDNLNSLNSLKSFCHSASVFPISPAVTALCFLWVTQRTPCINLLEWACDLPPRPFRTKMLILHLPGGSLVNSTVPGCWSLLWAALGQTTVSPSSCSLMKTVCIQQLVCDGVKGPGSLLQLWRVIPASEQHTAVNICLKC